MIPINNAEKKEALELYLTGVPCTIIAKRLNKSKGTINNWKIKYNWAKHASRMEEARDKKVYESNEERKLRLLKLSRKIQDKFEKSLPEQTIKSMEAIKAMDFEARLTGLEEIKIKATVETKPIQVNIIKPDENKENDK